MREDDVLRHYDLTRHVRYEEVQPGQYRCLECAEIGAAAYAQATYGESA